MDDLLDVTPRLKVPRSELLFRTSRSGGPGGQHVNTSSSRVELLFDFETSPSVSPEDRRTIRKKLAARLDREGRLRLVCQVHRSQHQNRDAAVRRFCAVLAGALRRERPRVATAPTRGSVARRMDKKRQRSTIKRLRSDRGDGD